MRIAISAAAAALLSLSCVAGAGKIGEMTPIDGPAQAGLVNAAVRSEIDAEVAALKAQIGSLTNELTAVKTTVGNINFGGDSVTTWILALGASGGLGGILYPLILRPLGIRAPSPVERKRKHGLFEDE